LRARAVETGCYIFAPAQCGDHANDRQTYGHSLIIDPWGKILAEAGESPCVIAADIDPSRVAAVRAMIPSLEHDRKFTLLA
jgi:predicted amidohydrolase